MTLVMALVACKQTPPEPGKPAVTAGWLSPTTETPRSNTATPATIPTQETATITFAVSEYSLSDYKALAETFNATHPMVRVIVKDISQIKGNWRQFAPTPEMLRELASSVDTFELPEHALAIGLANDIFLDLTPLAESDPGFTPDDFFPGLLSRFQREGKLWGLPASAGPILIFYNKSLFDQPGLGYPAPGWTWDDFLSAAVQLTAGEGNSKRFGFFDAWGGQGMFAFIQQHGGDLLDRAAPYPVPTLDDPLVTEAVRWYVDLTRKHGVSPERGATKLIPSSQVAAMWTDILLNWWGMSKGPKPVKVGIAPFPEDRTAANPMMVSGYFVSAGTAHPQACWQWISFITEQHVVSASVERMSTRRSVFESSDYFDRVGDDGKAAIVYALEHPDPPMTAYGLIVRGALVESMDSVWEGQATVEEALAQAQTLAEERIAQAVAEAAAAPTPPPVRPVPPPTPEVAPVKLAFIIGDELDAVPHQVLAYQFHQRHPEVSVTIKRSPAFNFGETAGSTDCFLWQTFARPDDWQQHIVRLQPFIEEARDFPLDDFYPQGLVDLGNEGDLRGLPLLLMPGLVYFNQDLFDAAGVPYPAPGWQWEDLVTTAEALTSGEGDAKQYGFAPSASAAPEAMAFTLQHGAYLVDDLDAPTAPTFNTQGAVEALSWLADLAHRYQVMPPLWAEDDLYAIALERESLIRSGQVAMWFDNPWAGDRGYRFAIGAVPLPADRQKATDSDSWAAYISAYSPHPTQCWEWLVYLSDRLTEGPGIPARRSLAEGADLTLGGDKAASLASMDHENTRLNRWRDRTCWMGWVYPWFQQAVQDVLSGREPPAQALGQVQSQAEAFLRCLTDPGGPLDEAEARSCARSVDPAYPVE